MTPNLVYNVNDHAGPLPRGTTRTVASSCMCRNIRQFRSTPVLNLPPPDDFLNLYGILNAIFMRVFIAKRFDLQRAFKKKTQTKAEELGTPCPEPYHNAKNRIKVRLYCRRSIDARFSKIYFQNYSHFHYIKYCGPDENVSGRPNSQKITNTDFSHFLQFTLFASRETRRIDDLLIWTFWWTKSREFAVT
jgi:hypothetical protein